MKKIIFLFGRVSAYVFPQKVLAIPSSVSNYFRTGYISRSIKNIGQNTIFHKGSVLIGPTYISIGNNTTIGKRVVISAWHKRSSDIPELSIGNNVSIGDDCHISAINKVIIGNDVLLGKKITITDNSHGDLSEHDCALPPIDRKHISRGSVIIGDRVWIGDKATILPNVSIGSAAIIGANSVVTKNVPPKAVAVGNPARIIKQL